MNEVTNMEQDCTQPFVAYAMESPSCLDIYGSCRDEILRKVDVSVISITGGYYKASVGNADDEMIYQSGVLGMSPSQCRRFTEVALARIVEPEERVTILYYTSRLQTAARIRTLEKSGIDVIWTDDVMPGYDSAYAVCSGFARKLLNTEWLDEVIGHDPLFVISSRGAECTLESKIKQAARKGESPVSPITAFLEQTEQRPDVALQQLGDYNLFAFLIGPDESSLAINCSSTDIAEVHRAFQDVATEVGITLFNAGHHIKTFTDFDGWLDWRPIFRSWKKVT